MGILSKEGGGGLPKSHFFWFLAWQFSFKVSLTCLYTILLFFVIPYSFFAFPSPIHSSSSYISSSSCCLLTFFPQSPTYYYYYHHTIIFIIYFLLFFSHVAWISTCKGRKMKAARITFAEIGFPFVSRISHFKEGFYFCTKSKRKSLFCHSVILQTTFCSLTDNIKRWKTFSMSHHRTIRLSVN